MYYTVKKEFPKGKFNVRISTCGEDVPLGIMFDDTLHDIDEMTRNIELGYVDYFRVKVEFIYHDIVISDSYLAGIYHENEDEAIEQGLGGHLVDLIRDAEAGAMIYIADLLEKLQKDFG